MNNSMNERLLKVRQTNVPKGPVNVCGNAESVKCSGRKRTRNSFESPSPSNRQSGHNSSPKCSFSTPSSNFSANDRLKKYREKLHQRKNEIVKVHHVFNKTVAHKNNEIIKPNINFNPSKKTRSMLGKHRLPQSDKSIDKKDDSVGGKKRRIDEHSQKNNVKKNCDSHLKQESILDNTIIREDYNRNDSSNDMDWSPIDQNEVVSNIQRLREDYREGSYKVRNLNQLNVMPNMAPINNSNIENETLYVVVDTNIFIGHLNIIQDMLSETYAACNHIVYVPWIVIQELDYFKDGRSGSSVMLKASKKAITFINNNLSQKHPRLKGQTVKEELYQRESSANPDDSILFCCLQLVQTLKSVILLSNDVNLRNKALINNITSYGPKHILTNIRNFSLTNGNKQKIVQISSTLSHMCTEVILAEMEEAYGSALNHLVKEPPWDLKQCLIYIKRFWNPVFSLVITQKQCLKTIEDLLTKIQSMDDISTEEDTEQFIKLCLSMCVYFKNCLNKHKKSV
ncbi:hypothetical protein AMK59_8785, partial [Oryctes borbonicus]